MRRPFPHLFALALVWLVSLAGCGIDEDVVAREAAEAAGPTTTTEAAVDRTSSPFTVEDVPAGYEPWVEGVGEDEPGDELPVTVLAPDGVAEGSGVVFVEAVPAVSADGFAAATDDGRWASLTTDGLRVWGIDATETELREVAEAATLPGEASETGGAPTVEAPPGDLEVVGSITVDGVLGLVAAVPDDPDGPVPGPASAHASVFTCDETCDGSLVAMTLPGDALDPEAVVTEVREPRRSSPDPRDAVAEAIPQGELDGTIVTTADPETGAVVRRILAAETEWGDVLLLVARGQDVLDVDALVAVAASVSPG
ncbi:MAG TPA: hypothetical protein VF228_12275 [Iamia sp.]